MLPSTNFSIDNDYNSAFTKAFNDYSRIIFYNGFICGFVTGSLITSYIFILNKKL